jgi:trehalose 6-phosphate synthase
VRAEVAKLDELAGDRRLIVRCDRMDPSKNIPRGFVAYDRLLAQHSEWRDRVTFVAMLTATRESLPQYVAYRREVEATATAVNERWGTDTWQPVVVCERDDYLQSVAAFVRYDVLLVNPLKDGLNLVAKEGPLANERDGVLCLSPEAGSYDELGDAAVAVHPYDVEQSAAGLHQALAMSADERASRAARLRARAGAHSPRSWLAEIVTHAR